MLRGQISLFWGARGKEGDPTPQPCSLCMLSGSRTPPIPAPGVIGLVAAAWQSQGPQEKPLPLIATGSGYVSQWQRQGLWELLLSLQLQEWNISMNSFNHNLQQPPYFRSNMRFKGNQREPLNQSHPMILITLLHIFYCLFSHNLECPDSRWTRMLAKGSVIFQSNAAQAETGRYHYYSYCCCDYYFIAYVLQWELSDLSASMLNQLQL